jgi:hypothetical protein
MAGNPEPRSGGSKSRTRTAAPRPSVIQAFELLRERLHAQMAILETLARERAAPQSAASARDLSQRERDLQQARTALKEEADRIECERALDLEKLDQDRELLAHAWENLEREQLTTPVPATEDRRLVLLTRQAPPANALSSAVEQSEIITRAVLEQFQSLRRDVRKNSQCKK